MIEELEVIDRAEEWAGFLKKKYKSTLDKISREYPSTRSLTIEYDVLEKYGKTGSLLADDLLERPEKTLGDIKDAIRTANLISGKDLEGQDITEKIIIGMNIRFIHLPQKTSIRNIRSEHYDKFISIEGVVGSVSEVCTRLVVGAFRCANGHITRKIQDYDTYREPDMCGNPECTQKKLELVQSLSTFIDSQKIKIQETPEELRGGEKPRKVDIECTGENCNKITTGDCVIVNGIVRGVQRKQNKKKSSFFDFCIECNSIEIPIEKFDDDVRNSS